MERLSPDLLRVAYGRGVFPMAESADSDSVFWMEPRWRGIIPIGAFHLSRSLRRRLLKGGYAITLDHAFVEVMDACADRSETWINATIREACIALHDEGNAHSLEVWEDGILAGGVYGIALGGAFFGESMFSDRRDGSKIALAYLLDHLQQTHYRLFDTQYLTPHLASLGGKEISRIAYRQQLAEALRHDGRFGAAPLPSPHELVQRITQIS